MRVEKFIFRWKTIILLSLIITIMLLFSLSLRVEGAEEDFLPGGGSSAETVVQEEEPAAGDFISDEETLRRAEAADSLWRKWMQVDEFDGSRSYWFRYSFEILDPLAGGTIWLTADDDFRLYINGEYIAEDEALETDWTLVKVYSIGDYLVVGKNTVAIEATDMDDTRQGLLVGLEYSTVTDINTKLELMVDMELAAQEERKAEYIRHQEAEQALLQLQKKPPTEEELREMRSIEKNKLD